MIYLRKYISLALCKIAHCSISSALAMDIHYSLALNLRYVQLVFDIHAADSYSYDRNQRYISKHKRWGSTQNRNLHIGTNSHNIQITYTGRVYD